MTARITAVEAIPVCIPTTRPHHLSNMTLTAGIFAIVRLATDEGTVGWGEAPLSMGPIFPEETWQSSVALIRDYFAPALIGQSFENHGLALRELDKIASRNYATKFAMETAIFDLKAKTAGVPIAQILGKIHRTEVPLSWSIASGDLSKEIAEARHYIQQGFRTFKVKLGFMRPAHDVHRLQVMREKLGANIDLRADVNGAWTVEIALETIKAIEKTGVDLTFIEQPVPARDFTGMRVIRQSVDTPVMLDEGLESIGDAELAIDIGAADFFSIKPMKHGGFLKTAQIVKMAGQAGIPCYLGSNLETSLGTAACLHYAAVMPELELGCELFGPLLLRDDIVDEAVPFGSGTVSCPLTAGVGVTTNESKVESHRQSSMESWSPAQALENCA